MAGEQGFNGSPGGPERCKLTDPQTFLICVQIRILRPSVRRVLGVELAGVPPVLRGVVVPSLPACVVWRCCTLTQLGVWCLRQ